MKAYIVMEIGWEYNDENYFRPEGKGGVPKIAYESSEDAMEACAKMTAKKFENPYNREMVTEWRAKDDVDFIMDFYEVKEIEVVGE